MTTGKDIASFFENGTSVQFEFCYKLYPQVLKLKAEKRSKKPQELIRLDEWYQNELPKLIKARGKDAHMIYDELVQSMKWKQSRGKFYPQLSYLVKVNTPRAVMTETKKAFRKLPNLEQAITALSNLKGVGTTMASALLAAAAPHSAPFMADECLMAIPEIEGIDYTTKEYLNFVQHIQTTVTRLNTDAGGETPFWSPHRVELALWAHYVANDLNPELLDEMPGPGAGGANAVGTNGSAVKVLIGTGVGGGGGDDTNDADDESLGAAAGQEGAGGEGGEPNNTATESETENENTNPPPVNMATTTVAAASDAATVDATTISVSTVGLQDGDSNFVSNDSTSQEPPPQQQPQPAEAQLPSSIIDDNTQTTTATTSTDDGEMGATDDDDSQSNLEAPAALAPQPQPLTNNNSSNRNGGGGVGPVEVPAAAANGNGTLPVVGIPEKDDEEDGGSDDDDDEEDDDDDDDDEENEDETKFSGGGHKSLTQINKEVSGNSIGTPAADQDSTALSGGQKRSLQSVGEGGDGGSVDGQQQPDSKKIRSD